MSAEISQLAACKCGAGFLAESRTAVNKLVEQHLQAEGDEGVNPHVVFIGRADQLARIPPVPAIEWDHV